MRAIRSNPVTNPKRSHPIANSNHFTNITIPKWQRLTQFIHN